MSDIGERIYQRRKELKITQHDLAEMIDVSDKTVSRWETGSTIPDASQIPLIACALKCEPNDLFDKEEAERSLAKPGEAKDVKKPFVVSIYAASGLALLSAILFALMVTLDIEGTGFLISGTTFAVASVCVYLASEALFFRAYSGRRRKEGEQRTDFLLSVVYFALICFLPAAVLSISIFHNISNELPKAIVCQGLYLLFVGLVFVFFKIKGQRLNRKTMPITLFFLSIGISITFFVLMFLGHPILIQASIIGMAFDIIIAAIAALTSTKA